jgi:hypothetical protein
LNTGLTVGTLADLAETSDRRRPCLTWLRRDGTYRGRFLLTIGA